MDNPRVSIVIPVYNGTDYMREAIDSALEQSYGNVEVIVVNDGSQDETAAVAMAYGDKIRYFSKENGGVSSALNVGIKHMTGNYFSYLPHDDILHKDKIKREIEAIKKSQNDMTIAWSGWNSLMEPQKSLVPFEIPFWYPKEEWTKKVYPLLFNILNTVTVLINKKYFDQVGMFDESLFTSQDYDMWFRTFRRHNTVYVDSELVNYRMHEKQGTQADPEFEKNCRELAMKMITSMSKEEMEDIFHSEYMFYYRMMGFYREAAWEDCYHFVKKGFFIEEEPVESEKRRQELKQFLSPNNEKIILFGAGKNGKRILKELLMRNIGTDAFYDSDLSKNGIYIHGIRCIAGEELPRENTTIILTFDHGEDMKKELTDKGYKRVFTGSEIASKLYSVPPVKSLVLEQV